MINLIFDVHNIAFRSFYAKGYNWMKSPRGSSGHIYGSMKQIFKMINLCKDEKFRLVFAYDKWPKRKLEQDPNYKGTREKPSFNPVPDVKALFNMIPSEIIYTMEEECDDTIGSYVYQTNEFCVINSSDKDLWQLLKQNNVRIINHQEFISEENILDKYKLPLAHCQKIALHKAIYGDSGDNIPNLGTRLQWKYLEPVFLKCDNDVDSFLKLAKEMLLEKHYNKLMEKEERFRLNFKLANLKKDLSYVSINNGGDRARLENFLISWGCKSIIKDIPMLFP